MTAQILLADDNHDVISMLESYLSEQNHGVVVANNGLELARKVGEHLPHLIITDVEMPGAYGSSVYKILQKDPRTKNIPVIFISAHPAEKLKDLLPNDPKTRFLQKPISFAKLDALISELLPSSG